MKGNRKRGSLCLRIVKNVNVSENEKEEIGNQTRNQNLNRNILLIA